MVGIELVRDRQTKERATAERDALVKACFTRGLLVLGAGRNAIRLSPGAYNLNGPQIAWLKDNGISDAIISEMQAHRAPAVVYQQPAPVYVIERRPPPPPVGFGVVYGGYRRW